jgi:hypothetical protein
MYKGGAVSKHCSILNYLRHSDNELYELIQDLCIGRMFIPPRGSSGLTFLRPSKTLLSKIKKEAEGDNPENAISMLQRMILLDHISGINDFKNKQDDIPNIRKKKLPIKKVSTNDVVLTNDSTIKIDKDFMARSDRNNIAVFILDGDPVETEEASAFLSANKKTKKGGAELFSANNTRKNVFEKVLSNMVEQNSDTAAELLIELLTWASDSDETKDIKELIRSQTSHDSLASLAIILQPYKLQGTMYISDDQLNEFTNFTYGDDASKKDKFISMPIYSRDMDIVEQYNNIVDKRFECCDVIDKERQELYNESAKPTIVNSIKKTLTSIKEKCDLPALRKNLSVNEMLAEAELRVLSAILLDNSSGSPDLNDLKRLFSSCNLYTPYMCATQETITNSNVGYYYSTVYLMARSDALCYVPGFKYNNKLSDIAKEEVCISLSHSVIDHMLDKRKKSEENIKHFCDFAKGRKSNKKNSSDE